MLGKRIKELRTQRNLTQKELAAKTSVTDATIGHYEMGSRTPPVDMLNRLADFFEVSVDYLLGRTDIPNLYTQKEIIERQRKALKEYFTLKELEAFIDSKRDS